MMPPASSKAQFQDMAYRNYLKSRTDSLGPNEKSDKMLTLNSQTTSGILKTERYLFHLSIAELL